MNIGQTIGRVIRFLFTTNRAIWFEKPSSEKIHGVQPKISLTIDTDSTEEVINWLQQQKESWVVHNQEINTARVYQHLWFSARHKGKIIGCIKIGFNQIYISDFDKTYSFPHDVAFIYDTFVVESFRKKGVARALIHEACMSMKKKGFQRIGCHIPPWNQASIQAYEKNGFEKTCFIRFIQLCGIKVSYMKPLRASFNHSKKRIGKVTIPYETKDL